MRKMTTDILEIRKITRKYYQQLRAYYFDNLEKMDNILGQFPTTNAC